MTDYRFPGFTLPHQNWSKLPHQLIDALPQIETVAELKVILYVLRHTWGFAEYGRRKRITTDEFIHGRILRDGQRIDGGTGLSAPSVRTGLDLAERHGFLLVDIDDSDKARIRKYYTLNLLIDPEDQMVKDLPSEEKDLLSGGKSFTIDQRKKLFKETKGKEKDSQRKKPAAPAANKSDQDLPYQWPKDLKELGVGFEQIIGRGPLSRGEYAFWMNGSKQGGHGLRHYLRGGITLEEMRRAGREMIRAKLTIKSPASLWAFAWSIHAKASGNINDHDDLKALQARRQAEEAANHETYG